MNQFDFIFVGPQRTASSWLREVLIQHPEIKLPDWVKETHTFSAGHYSADFDKFWQNGSGNLKVGEFGPLYFTDPLAIQRIKEHNPNCKIIIGVREPVEKTLSLFQHYYAIGLGSKDFEKTCFKHPEIIYSGNYRFWVPEWEDKFGADQLFFFSYHQLKTDPNSVMSKLANFLHIDFARMNYNVEQKVGNAEIPHSYLLTKSLVNGAKFLRKINFHGLVALANGLGLRKAIAKKEKLEVNSQLVSKLENYFHKDRYYLGF